MRDEKEYQAALLAAVKLKDTGGLQEFFRMFFSDFTNDVTVGRGASLDGSVDTANLIVHRARQYDRMWRSFFQDGAASGEVFISYARTFFNDPELGFTEEAKRMLSYL